ncbi:MAG: YhbY family RNA-binding protein [archaeon]|nr:YhbY family RNA-binding protein [archaeon]
MIRLQIGKNGLTEEFIENLKIAFVKTENIRVSVLKHGTRDREQLKKWAEEIVFKLGKNFTSKVIGFTIVLRKWRKGKDMRVV